MLSTEPNRKEYFEETSSFWEEQYENRGLRGCGVQERTALGVGAMRANAPIDGSYVLDLGAGPGIAADHLAAANVPVCAVDFSENLTQRSRQRFQHNRRRNACVVRADAHHLPFADHSFGGAMCIALVTWVADPKAVVRELARVLKPGSAAVITCRTKYYCGDLLDPLFWTRQFLPASVRRVFSRMRGRSGEAAVEPRRFATRKFNAMLREAGFTVEFWRTIQYGDFRVLNRSILPMKWQVGFNKAMERIWHYPLVRRLGWTYYVQVRVPDKTPHRIG